MNIRNLIGVACIATALIAGGTYAFSATPAAEEANTPAEVCKVAPATETIKRLTEGGATATPVSQGEVNKLVESKGSPPGADGKPFTIIRLDLNDYSALLVVQGDCINDKVGPVPSQLIDNVLGSVKAQEHSSVYAVGANG